MIIKNISKKNWLGSVAAVGLEREVCLGHSPCQGSDHQGWLAQIIRLLTTNFSSALDFSLDLGWIQPSIQRSSKAFLTQVSWIQPDNFHTCRPLHGSNSKLPQAPREKHTKCATRSAFRSLCCSFLPSRKHKNRCITTESIRRSLSVPPPPNKSLSVSPSSSLFTG